MKITFQFVLLLISITIIKANDCSIIEELLTNNNIEITWSKTNTTGCCGYSGIQCVDTSVTVIELNGRNLSGNLEKIFTLTSLQYINLSENSFTGSIPSSVKSLSNLQYLYLNKNKLTGEIPNEIAVSKLQFLYLSGNELEGSIPSSLGKIFNLQHLDLSSNKLSGDIPSSLSQLKNIQYLKLSNNENLCGEIPILSNTLKKCDFESTSLCVNEARDHCTSNIYTSCSDIKCELDNSKNDEDDILDEDEEGNGIHEATTTEKVLKWIAIGVLILVIICLVILQLICLRKRYKNSPRFVYKPSKASEVKNVPIFPDTDISSNDNYNIDSRNTINDDQIYSEPQQQQSPINNIEQDISNINFSNQNRSSTLILPQSINSNSIVDSSPVSSNTISAYSPQLYYDSTHNDNINNDNNNIYNKNVLTKNSTVMIGMNEMNKQNRLPKLSKNKTLSNPNLYYLNRQSLTFTNNKQNRNSYSSCMDITSYSVDGINRNGKNMSLYPLSSQTVNNSIISNRTIDNYHTVNNNPSIVLTSSQQTINNTYLERKTNSCSDMKNMKNNNNYKFDIKSHRNSYPESPCSNTRQNNLIIKKSTNKINRNSMVPSPLSLYNEISYKYDEINEEEKNSALNPPQNKSMENEVNLQNENESVSSSSSKYHDIGSIESREENNEVNNDWNVIIENQIINENQQDIDIKNNNIDIKDSQNNINSLKESIYNITNENENNQMNEINTMENQINNKTEGDENNITQNDISSNSPSIEPRPIENDKLEMEKKIQQQQQQFRKFQLQQQQHLLQQQQQKLALQNMIYNNDYSENNEYGNTYSNFTESSNIEQENEIISGQKSEIEDEIRNNEQQPPNYDEVLSETMFSPVLRNSTYIEPNDESIRMQLEMRRIEERQLRMEYLQRQINNSDLTPEQRQRYVDALDRLMLED